VIIPRLAFVENAITLLVVPRSIPMAGSFDMAEILSLYY